ncbi:glycosyltransferase [Nocardioides pantholopis]|uniref:glycosyltransferase n=1 Tax=Nocardioides pantholopis TaxID=2483798 RepID=UPI0013DE220A|nr:glycosyltransferase [Nocardioides pantholopis]
MSGLVVALVGTDHHPFERLVQWVDAAAACRPGVRFVLQHGSSRAPEVAEGHASLAHDHLVELLAQASAVICHGGPGTIMDARDAGHRPLCVPRDPRRGEHVDGHQLRFAEVVAAAGVVRAVGSLPQLDRELDLLLAAPRGAVSGRAEQDGVAARAARELLAAELDALLSARPRRWARGARAAR